MTDDVMIRRCVVDDAASVSRLVCDVLYASNLADYGHENVSRVAGHFSEDGVRVMIAQRDAVFVAMLGDQIVGTVSLDLDHAEKVGRVRAFFVDARHQGKGIGARLFGQLQQIANADGIARLTVRSSLFAVQFYKRLGFVVVRDHWDGDERTVEMRN